MKHIRLYHNELHKHLRCPFCSKEHSWRQVYRKHVVKCCPDQFTFKPVRSVPLRKLGETQNNQLDEILPCNLNDNESNNNIIEAGKFENFALDLKNNALEHVLSIIANSDITMKRTTDVIKGIKLVTNPISKLIDKKAIGDLDGEKDEIIKAISDPYEHINTEKKLISCLTKKKLYAPPIKFCIEKHLQTTVRKGIHFLKTKPVTGVVMPIKFIFQQILELPGTFQKMHSTMLKLMEQESCYDHFVQGKRWRKIVNENPNKIVLPYHVYHDDFDVGNAQGTKRGIQAIAGINLHFPLFEDYELSKLKFIFPAAFVKKSHTKKFRKSHCFRKLIQDLKEIGENGIEITIEGEKKKVFMILGLVISDNLAQHELLDFTASFSHRQMCRFCRMGKNERMVAVREKPELLRDKEDYLEDTNDPSTGVVANSPFNSIPHFHVYDNFSVDVMHDVLEGAIKIGLTNAIDEFIKKEYFTAQEFCELLDNFDYGEIDSRNRLSASNYKNGTLLLNSKDSLLLIKYFTLIVGHKIPQNDSTLQYVITLEKLVKLCLSMHFDDEKLELLRSTIEKHNTLYQKFTKVVIDSKTNKEIEKNVSLTPKLHLLLHYCYIIIHFGAVAKFWSMRHEGSNRLYKIYANIIACKINLSLSLAKKSAMRFAYFLFCERKGKDPITVCKKKENFILENKLYQNLLILPEDIKVKLQYEYGAVYYKGTEYKTGFFVFFDDTLYKIVEMVTTEIIDKVYLILERYTKIRSSLNFNCYWVVESTGLYKFEDIEQCGRPFNICKLQDGKRAFKINEYL